MRVLRVDRSDIRDFIETYHYSKSINGCISDYCYGLYDEDKLIGAMFYGRMAMRNQYKAYAENPDDVIELRRLCCIDDTPKNVESFFIGKTLKMLKREWNPNGIVVSYADKTHGHDGIIYKASNFEFRGFVKGAKVILHNGKHYHDKAIRTKYKGVLKPYAQRLKDALDVGEASWVSTKGKNIYVYKLNRRKRDRNKYERS